jgi:hypothetical protein
MESINPDNVNPHMKRPEQFGLTPTPPAVQPCPSCGHCPTCGRGPALPINWPYWPVWCTYPPTVIQCSRGTTIFGSSTFALKPGDEPTEGVC